MSQNTKRVVPNPQSKLLQQAVVGGAGLGIPQNMQLPPGCAAIVLLVPATVLTQMNPMQIQADLSLPWSDGTAGPGVWFEDFKS